MPPSSSEAMIFSRRAARKNSKLTPSKLSRSRSNGPGVALILRNPVENLGFDFVEREIQLEIVAELFGVALIAFEIVDAGTDELAGSFSGADRVNGVADHHQSLVGDHHFVVFDVVADEHQDLFLRHVALRSFGSLRIANERSGRISK